MNVVWVDTRYAFSDRQHDRIIGGIGPCLEIANIHPNDIRDIHIVITEVSSESRRFPRIHVAVERPRRVLAALPPLHFGAN